MADGLASTARVITAAAAIMVCVFGSFVINDPLRVLDVFGLGLAAAIFVDATLVRMVLVPSVMQLLGPGQLVDAPLARAGSPHPRRRSDPGYAAGAIKVPDNRDEPPALDSSGGDHAQVKLLLDPYARATGPRRTPFCWRSPGA